MPSMTSETTSTYKMNTYTYKLLIKHNHMTTTKKPIAKKKNFAPTKREVNKVNER